MSAGKNKFELGDAVFQAFKLPGGLSFLVRLIISMSILLGILWAVFAGPIVSAYVEFFNFVIELEEAGREPSPWEIIGPMLSLMGIFSILGFVSWFIMASAETALHKNKLHGVDLGIFPLRFGMAEIRVMIAQLVVGLVITGIVVVGYGLTALLVVAAIAGGQVNGALGFLGGLLAFLVIMGMIVALVLASVRLAPTAALSVRDNELKTLQGWHVSKGRFWPMLGSFFIIMIITSIVQQTIMTGGMMALMPMIGDLESLASVDSDDPAVVWEIIKTAFLQPSVLIPLVIVMIIYIIGQMLSYCAIWGVSSYVAGLDDDTMPEIFD